MILRTLASPLPIAWDTADSAYGQDSHFRRFLEDTKLSYVVAVPKSQQVNGPRIDHLITQAPPEAWLRLAAGPGAKGERFYDWAAARLPAVAEPDGGEPARQRWMLARRSISKPDEIAYYLACAHWTPASPTWSESPDADGRSRSASRARRTSADWSSTRSAATWAGTGTSRSPCSPTRSSR